MLEKRTRKESKEEIQGRSGEEKKKREIEGRSEIKEKSKEYQSDNSAHICLERTPEKKTEQSTRNQQDWSIIHLGGSEEYHMHRKKKREAQGRRSCLIYQSKIQSSYIDWTQRHPLGQTIRINLPEKGNNKSRPSN